MTNNIVIANSITWYCYDNQGIFTASVDFNIYGPVPPQSTDMAPPTVTGSKVAQWQGDRWVVLNARPAPLPVPEPVPPVLVWSLFDFYRLFTQAERLAIDAATDPAVKDFWRLVASATSLSSNDADVVAGVTNLQTKALIATGRAAQILSGAKPTP